MLLLINNVHDKIMQNSVIGLSHVQNNLFTSDCQYFHNEKTYCYDDVLRTFFYSEKYLSSQAGLEPTTFRSPVRRSNH